MSRKALDWAWESTLPSSEKFLLVALSVYADANNKCYPTVDQLMQKTNLSQATIFRGIQALEKAGVLTRNKKKKRGEKGQLNCYQLHPEKRWSPVSQREPLTMRTSHHENKTLSPCESTPYIRSIVNTSYYTILLSIFIVLSSNKNLNAILLFSLFAQKTGNGKIADAPVFFDDNFKLESPATKKPKIPPCPYQEIVELYKKWLPMCPAIHTLTETRKRYIQARWRENPDLVNFDKFFKWVSKSRFLTGQVSARGDRRPFVATLDWLMRPENHVKVLEHKYHE